MITQKHRETCRIFSTGLACIASVLLAASVSLTQAADVKPEGAAPAADMALIPGGDFTMGSAGSKDTPPNETPRHAVNVSPFYIDRYEVTNGSFAAFLNAVKKDDFEKKRKTWVINRNDLNDDPSTVWWPTEITLEKGAYRAVPGSEKYPVLSVSWYAADAYCRWAGKRLPTEAEWEKAARGGLDNKDYPWGDRLPTAGIIFSRLWMNNFYPAPTEVTAGSYPNGFGLYDMAGNVAEWCSDWYDPDYYGRSPRNNPKGPERGTQKVVRGGSWASDAKSVRAGFRSFSLPEAMNTGVGFRCAEDGPAK